MRIDQQITQTSARPRPRKVTTSVNKSMHPSHIDLYKTKPNATQHYLYRYRRRERLGVSIGTRVDMGRSTIISCYRKGEQEMPARHIASRCDSLTYVLCFLQVALAGVWLYLVPLPKPLFFLPSAVSPRASRCLCTGLAIQLIRASRRMALWWGLGVSERTRNESREA